MNNQNWYLTTTIPYVNGEPHVGFALELVQADVLARHRRLQGYNVRLQTGSDENSLKNVSAAEAAGRAVEEFVAANAERFLQLQGALNVSADDFLRTASDPRHKPGVEALWQACVESGDIYQKEYSGLYCNGCEQFYADSELDSGCCPEHGTRPETVSETNWFFRLSKYAKAIKTAVENNEIEILPASKRNEALSQLDSHAEDFSVSRSSERARGWGIPVPRDPSQTIYVWFDALGNYVTALGYGSDERDLEFWNAAAHREHLVGKGVTRFHTVYWPAILLSAGLPLPTRIFVHGYLTVEGKKIGKSNGNAIDPLPLVETYGTDVVRYYLLRHIRSSEDGDFSISRLKTACNSELGGQLGNLLNRTLTLVVKYRASTIPSTSAPPSLFALNVHGLSDIVQRFIEEFSFDNALYAILELVAQANRYIVAEAPWSLGKLKLAADHPEERQIASERFDQVLFDLCSAIAAIGKCLAPLLPDTSARILERVGCTKVDKWDEGPTVAGKKVIANGQLFPRI